MSRAKTNLVICPYCQSGNLVGVKRAIKWLYRCLNCGKFFESA